MSIISHELIVNINEKFSVFNSLVNRIKNRDDRKAFEEFYLYI